MKYKVFDNIIPSSGEVAVLLYGNVGEGCQVDSARVVAELSELARTYHKIDVRINSLGGDVFSGVAIFNALRSSGADITVYVDGVAASIAGVIALCGKPLYMSPYARLMLHNVRGSAYGTASDLRSVADSINSIEETLADMIASRMKMPAEEVRSTYLSGGDHWFTARQAVDMGLADGIYEGSDHPITAQTPMEEIYQYTNQIFYDKNSNTMKMTKTLLDQIRAVPSFEGVSDEESLLTRLEALYAENHTFKAQQKEEEERRMQADCQRITEALERGRINADQAASLQALLIHDREQTLHLLGSITAKAPVARASQVYSDTVEGSLSTMSWDELDRAGRLDTLKRTDFDRFKDMYKARFGVEYK